MAYVRVVALLLLSVPMAALTMQDDDSSCSSGASLEAPRSSSSLIQAAAKPTLLQEDEKKEEQEETMEETKEEAKEETTEETKEESKEDTKEETTEETEETKEETQEKLTFKSLDLPKDLIQLGKDLFDDEAELEDIVMNSQEINVTLFDVNIKLRIKKGDNAIVRLPDEGRTDEYGIKELLNEGPTPHGMINVIDMGANYGVIPIALFHLYPKYVRAVVTEPIPATYFFLRWNLKLNGVPELTDVEMYKTGDIRTPGVLAINKGVAEDDRDMHFCWAKDNSMNAMMCDCKKPPFPSECLHIETMTTAKLMKFFGEDGVDFLKMDCEGCELHSLPALDKMPGAQEKVRRLVGELHEVPPKIEDMACKFNTKTWMTKVCAQPRGAGQWLECDPKTRDEKCYVPVPWPRP